MVAESSSAMTGKNLNKSGCPDMLHEGCMNYVRHEAFVPHEQMSTSAKVAVHRRYQRRFIHVQLPEGTMVVKADTDAAVVQ